MARLARGTSQTSKGFGVKSCRLTVKLRKQEQNNNENNEVKSMASASEKPKKTPRIRIIGSTPLSKNWVDHGMTLDEQNKTPSQADNKNIIKITSRRFNLDRAIKPTIDCKTSAQHPAADNIPNGNEMENDDSDYDHDVAGVDDTMSLDSESEVERLMGTNSNNFKAADHVHKVVAHWGKGTECVMEWGFRQSSTTYKSKGTVVGRSARQGQVKIKISYEPAPGNDGPKGFLYLPQSSKIKICSLRATKLVKVEVQAKNFEEEASKISSEDGQSDLEPLPHMARIDPSFSVHVVAIFRAIIRGYSNAKLDSEKEAIWHKFLNAPRDSLASVRTLARRTTTVGHVRKMEHLDAENSLTPEERDELQIDKRSIRNALNTARAGNTGKEVRILDNIYRDSPLTAEEKVRKLKELHPEGPAIDIEVYG